ncbi:MAG: threonine/serine exporter family protein [Bacteroides sp.]|nr:threonine/serine exporter family protein [Roseburia sp.]MCM1346673.1 threonine/serine exporter family protein [Bacteroides sp.]MCM1422141.1 threonine/serine exporter family protein [Bacteroides sp.]
MVLIITAMMDSVLKIIEDGLFAAVAAVGFATISNPPRGAYFYCALIAAVGHAVRFVLMHNVTGGIHIIYASFAASLVVGALAVIVAPRAKFPAETCFFPALLPMIPGMYAYRTVEALVLCIASGQDETAYNHWFYLFSSNGLICTFIVFGLVTGAAIPVFLFKRWSFQATR